MGYTNERVEHKECMSIWGARPPARKLRLAERCSCCEVELNEAEEREGQGKCFPCIKGNCDKCK